MDKNNKKFVPKGNSNFNENNNNNFQIIINVGSDNSDEEKSNGKNMPNEEKETLFYAYDISDPNNDIQIEQTDDNFIKKRRKRRNKIEKKINLSHF